MTPLRCVFITHPDVLIAISRRWDQPGSGGGNWFAFVVEPPTLCSGWQALDMPLRVP